MAFRNCKPCSMWLSNVWWNRSVLLVVNFDEEWKRLIVHSALVFDSVYATWSTSNVYCMYTLCVSVFYCIWLRVVQTSCWYLHCSSLLTFKLISAYLLSEQLPAFWSVRSLDNASKLKSFVNPIAWLLESHWELFNINGEGLPDSQSHFLFIIQACISTSCFPHTDNNLLLNCLIQNS